MKNNIERKNERSGFIHHSNDFLGKSFSYLPAQEPHLPFHKKGSGYILTPSVKYDHVTHKKKRTLLKILKTLAAVTWK